MKKEKLDIKDLLFLAIIIVPFLLLLIFAQ
jgi:hypothetical protein